MTSKLERKDYFTFNGSSCDTSTDNEQTDEEEDVYAFTDTFTFNSPRSTLRPKRVTTTTTDKDVTVNGKQPTTTTSTSMASTKDSPIATKRNKTNKSRASSTENSVKRKTVTTIVPSNVVEETNERLKRKRQQYQPFQVANGSSTSDTNSSSKNSITNASTTNSNNNVEENKDKMIIYASGDFLAVRNETNSFFICRAKQNIRFNARKIRIQWYSNDANPKSYVPDFYDYIDFETILTNILVTKQEKGAVGLPQTEHQRVTNILERAINVEKGINSPPDPTKVLKDGVDISIIGKVKEEEVLKKIKRDRSKETTPEPSSSNNNNTFKTNGHQTEHNSKGLKSKNKSSTISINFTADNDELAKDNIPFKKNKKRKTLTVFAPSNIDEEPTPKLSKLRSTNNSNQNTATSAAASEGKSKREEKVTKIKEEINQETVIVKLDRRRKKRGARSKKEETILEMKMEQPSPTKTIRKKDGRGKLSKKQCSPIKHEMNDSIEQIPISQDNGMSTSIINSSQIGMPIESESSREELEDEFNATKLLQECRFVSTYAHSRLLIRATKERNLALIEQLLTEEPEHFCSATIRGSVNTKEDAIRVAIRNEDFDLLNTLRQHSISGRLGTFPHYIETMELHHSELFLDQDEYKQGHKQLDYLDESYARYALKANVSLAFLCKIQHFFKRKLEVYTSNLLAAAKAGNFEVIDFFMSDTLECDKLGRVPVLKEPAKFLPETCTKYFPNAGLRPIHLAAINSDPCPFVNLITSDAINDLYVTDASGWSPIHYAAVSSSSFSLQQLLFRCVSTTVIDNNGNTPLHLAVRRNRYDNVYHIVNKEQSSGGGSSSSLVAYNAKGWTPLHIACKKGHLEILKLFNAKQTYLDQTTSIDADELTPLMIAVQYGHLAIVRLLVENGATLTPFDKKNRNALTHAVINGHPQIVAYLLESGINPALCRDIFGNNLFHHALAYGWYGCYSLLLKTNVSLKDTNCFGLTPLGAAFQKGHLGLIENVLEQNIVNVNMPVNDSGLNLVMLTFSLPPDESMWQCFRMFAEKFNANFTKTDCKGKNALHYFLECECRHKCLSYKPIVKAKMLQILGVILKNGCDPFQAYYKMTKFQQVLADNEYFWQMIITNYLQEIETETERISFGEYIRRICEQQKSIHSILQHLCYKPGKNGDIPIEILLKSMSSLASEAEARRQMLPAQLAQERLNFLKFLVSFYESKFLDDIHLLHLAVKHCSTIEMKYLVGQFATSLERLDENGNTPLVVALKRGNSEAACVLIEAGANFNLDIEKHPLPIYAVRYLSSVETVIHFLKHGIDLTTVDDECNTLLHLICLDVTRPYSLRSIRALLDKGLPVNVTNRSGETALHFLLKKNRSSTNLYDILALLDKKGINPFVKDSTGKTALSYIFNSLLNIDDAFHVLQQFATPKHNLRNFIDDEGRGLLHYAAMSGFTPCVYSLLPYIDVNAPDMNNNTPLALAIVNNHKECAVALMKYDKLMYTHYEFREGQTRQNLYKLISTRDWFDFLCEIAEKERHGERVPLLIESLLKSGCITVAYKIFIHFRNIVRWTDSELRSILQLFGKHATAETPLAVQKQILQFFGVELLNELFIELFINSLYNWNHHLTNEIIKMYGLEKIFKFRMMDNYIALIFVKLAIEKGQLPSEMVSIILVLIKEVPIDTLFTYPIVESLDDFHRYTIREHLDKSAYVQYSPLIVAVINRDYRLVKWMISSDVSAGLNFADSKGKTPLMHAVLMNDFKMVKLLLNKGYDYESDENPWVNETPLVNSNELTLQASDRRGFTVFHHALAYNSNYTYTHGSVIFETLWKLLDTKIQANLTADLLSLANKVGSKKITALLEGKNQIMIKAGTTIGINRHSPTRCQPKNNESPEKLKISGLKNKADELRYTLSQHVTGPSPRRENILVDEATDSPYDVTLTKLDVQKSNYIYNFYQMQLTTAGSKFVLIIRFGKVGTFGNVQKKIFDLKAKAVEEFKKLFFLKSGNEWNSIETGENNKSTNPKSLVDEKESDIAKMNNNTNHNNHNDNIELNFDIEHLKTMKTELPAPVKDLFIRFFEYDLDKVKLGDDIHRFKLSVNLVKKCEAILHKIYRLILEKSTAQGRKEEVKCLNDIIDLSEEFYSSILIFGDRFDRLKPLLEFRDFYKTYEFIHQLKSYIFAKEELSRAKAIKREMNPIDVMYERFIYRIQSLPKGFNPMAPIEQQETIETKTILSYLKNAFDSDYVITSIYTIQMAARPKVVVFENDEPNENNTYLLWYNLENYQIFDTFINGINAKPIVTNSHPPQIINGIILQNYISKSEKTIKENYNYTLLCQAKLGNILEVDSAEKLIESMTVGKNCIVIDSYIDKYDSIRNCINWNGQTIPLRESTRLSKRYIVINSSEVIPKYLIEYKFND